MATITRLASEKQFAFLLTLVQERGPQAKVYVDTQMTACRVGHPSQFTMTEMTNVINVIKEMPVLNAQPRTEAPEGMHKFGGVIFKVQRAVHGSGNLYAKALLEDGEGGWHFEFASGAVRNLSASTLLTLEEAKAFGALYGTCCVCGRTLTDEGSIEAGIGPVCASKF